MVLENPYPFVDEIHLVVEAEQFGKENYCVPTAVMLSEDDEMLDDEESICGRLDREDLLQLAKRRGYDFVCEMICDDFQNEIEQFVMENSHEYLMPVGM